MRTLQMAPNRDMPRCAKSLRRFAMVWLSVVGLGSIDAAARAAAADAKPFEEVVRPFLVRHCFDCHGAVKPKKGLRLDQLTADFADPASRAKWQAVLKRVQAGEMPPEDKPQPAVREVQLLADWINGQTAAQGRVVLRRLNRVEYENTVRDLLGVEIDLQDLLPPDSAADGFDNVGAALHMSSFLMERYLEAADKALGVAIANGPQPPTLKQSYSLKDERQVKREPKPQVTGRKAGEVYRVLDDAVVLFSSSPAATVRLAHFYPPDRGRYRFRISASGFQSAGKPVAYAVTAGAAGKAGKRGLVDYFDAAADKPTVVEFVEHFEARQTISILPYGLAREQLVRREPIDEYKGPGLAIQWIDVEGPLHSSWLPESHRRLFGDLPQAPAPTYNFRNRVEVVSKEPLADADRILRNFARRAFRRSVAVADIEPYLALVKARLAASYSFEQAVRVGLTAIMVSPEFLFLREKPGPLDEFALAARLSYFLWTSMPDDELLTLAERGLLAQPATLRQQVERMLKDPRAAAFTEHFCGQWLGLRDIDFTEPSHILYPEYDHMLKVSMVRETELFFAEILQNDLSLTNFVASDFTMLNGRLAKHYGIPGVNGWQFRKVPLPPGSHRGGVLTMASVLKVTANGTTTSPVPRGAWVLDRILGTPPPPPPEGVSALEPDIRGATTIREQLAKHRSVAACASCHARIDPPGFALESFDVIGGWREDYRVSGWRRGGEVMVDNQKMPYYKGARVDPTDILPDGRRFANIDEFKQLMLADKDQLARALAAKLLTFATGAAPTAADQPAIAAIVRNTRDKQYGLRTLIHEIVQSKLFQTK